jgi:iron complex transport system permease protein
LAIAVFLSARMNVLSLGDEVAASLGNHVGLCRGLAIFTAALLAASAVCLGGLLGFVGLIAPHAARFLFGHDHKRLVPLTALLGGGLTGLCDILARLLFAPFELPVGIVLSVLGAPFFLLLIVRRRRVVL